MRLALERVATRTRGQPGLHRTSLILDPGLTVLLGPTLAGKTTLMRLMAGLERPVEGGVLADGRDATGLPVRRRSVAMVYQQFVNYPSLTVFDNIASPLRVARLGAGTGAGFVPPPHLAPLAPGPYSFGVRANHLRVARRSSAEVALPARVALAEVNGSETFIHASPVDAAGGDGVVADIVVQEEGIHTPALGTPVTVHLDPARPASPGPPPATTCRTTRSWPSSGGRTWPWRPPASRPRKPRWTTSPSSRTTSCAGWSGPTSAGTARPS